MCECLWGRGRERQRSGAIMPVLALVLMCERVLLKTTSSFRYEVISLLASVTDLRAPFSTATELCDANAISPDSQSQRLSFLVFWHQRHLSYLHQWSLKCWFSFLFMYLQIRIGDGKTNAQTLVIFVMVRRFCPLITLITHKFSVNSVNESMTHSLLWNL